jgi:hypothetical protein
VLEYRIERRMLQFRWANVVPGFDMPVRVTLSRGGLMFIRPTESWQGTSIDLESPSDFKVDVNFYVTAKRVEN